MSAREALRPWKLTTFLCGTTFFVWGAYHWSLPTWDVGVSLLMSVCCYLLAPSIVKRLIRGMHARGAQRAGDLALATALLYFTASGTYEIYNTLRLGEHPVTYWYNLAFSVPVTIIAGTLWSFDESLAKLLHEIRAAFDDTASALLGRPTSRYSPAPASPGRTRRTDAA